MSDRVSYPTPTVLEIYRDLPGPIERVWDYLTQSHLRQKWICAGVVASEVGGEIEFKFDHTNLSKHPTPRTHEDTGEPDMVGEIRVYDPPHHLAFSWPSEDPDLPTAVVIKLTEIEGGVRLHLRHEKITSREHIAGASAGWHTHLDILSDLLKGGAVRDFWEQFIPLEKDYQETVAAPE